MRSIEIVQSDTLPEIVEQGEEYASGYYYYYLNCDVHEINNENGQTMYEYARIQMYPNEIQQGKIVSTIMQLKYDNDRMQAIINNFLQETDLVQLINMLRITQNFNKLRSAMNEWIAGMDADIINEYMEMQEWRIYAKNTAKQALGLYDRILNK